MTHRLAIVVLCVLHVAAASATAQWRVYNNLPEQFTIQVWPENQPDFVSRKTISRNTSEVLRLGRDQHRIQLESEGGNIYYLKPAALMNKGNSDLKTILTPAGTKNGKRVYNYMNQNGFDKSDRAQEISRLSHSTWSTSYSAIDNSRVSAQLEFQGGSGGYPAGVLYNVRYRRVNRGKYLIDGRWRARNDRSVAGAFSFAVDPAAGRFDGEYTYNGRKFDWNGRRLQPRSQEK